MDRLSAEVLPKFPPDKNLPHHQLRDEVETITTSDVLWKQLQLELKNSSVRTNIGIPEITTRFIEKHREHLDYQQERRASMSCIGAASSSPKPSVMKDRRSSNPEAYKKKSSITDLVKSTINIRRALSFGSDEMEQSPRPFYAYRREPTPTNNNLSDFRDVPQCMSRASGSVIGNETRVDVADGTSDHAEQKPLTTCQEEDDDFGTDDSDDGFDDNESSNGELLVMFPEKPRHLLRQRADGSRPHTTARRA